MDYATALLAAIIAAPADDLCRLVYCDYLEESGDPAATEDAKFIRTQIELAKTEAELNELRRGDLPHEAEQTRVTQLQEKVQQLFDQRQLGRLTDSDLPFVRIPPVEDDVYGPFGIVRRGFVDEVVCDLGAWIEFDPLSGTATGIGRRMVSRHPIRTVTLKGNAPRYSDRIGGYILPDIPDRIRSRMTSVGFWNGDDGPGFADESEAVNALSDALISAANDETLWVPTAAQS